MEFKVLEENNADDIVLLGCELNPALGDEVIRSRLLEMFSYPSYICFGMFENTKLIGVASGWLSTRFYSGKQLEIDNVIVSKEFQSKGMGKEFLEFIENWASEKDCMTVELNTYVTNDRSHKFYFNQGYSILGYHFQKELNK